MIEIECPGCGGEGYTENMTWLTYDGAQTWVRNQCHECHGDKFVNVPARCTGCDEEVLAKIGEWVKDGDGYMCAYCANISPDDNTAELCGKCNGEGNTYSALYDTWVVCISCDGTGKKNPLDNGGRIE